MTLYKRGETVINDFAPITELSRYVRFINLNYVRGWLKKNKKKKCHCALEIFFMMEILIRVSIFEKKMNWP